MRITTDQGTAGLENGTLALIKIADDEGNTLAELEIKQSRIYIAIFDPDKVVTLVKV